MYNSSEEPGNCELFEWRNTDNTYTVGLGNENGVIYERLYLGIISGESRRGKGGTFSPNIG